MNNKDIPQMKPMLNTTKTINPATTIVFIDAGVENADLLIEGVIPTTEVFVLDGTADGIEQISQVLQQRQNIDAVHIISHGSPGCLYLGNSQLSLDNLNRYAPQLQQWDVVNVLLYGCNVAAGDAGEEFITKLHALTGANIAASKTLTGSAAKGGNWELEMTTGTIESSLAFTTETMATYQSILADIFVESFANNSQGWTLGPEWQIGSATASSGGVGNPDPSVDNTITSDNGVAGVVIGGNASTALHDYYYLTSPVINTNTSGSVVFDYYRWLNSDYAPYMTNKVEIFNGSSWTPLWINSQGTYDAAWTPQSFDISAYKSANTQIRFGFNIGSNGVYTIGSWNIDDVKIYTNNVAPTDISLSRSSINENVAANSAVGTFTSTDPDTGNTFTYSLVAGTGDTNNSAFSIVSNELQINASPDFEAQSTYNIRVRTTDQGGLTYDKPLVVNINNVNETPTDLTLSNNSINENVAANSAVGTFTSTDPDTGNTFTYSLVAGTGDTNNSAFSIVSNELRINASPDFETKSSYSIRVRTTDAGGLTYDKPLVVNINDIDEFVNLTPNNDLFQGTGTASADQINGLPGSDRLYGNAGNDTINGGDGDDVVYGGNDNDLLLGGNGSDRLYGDAGNDELLGEVGNDILYGGDGNDILNGGAGSDQLYGNAGSDTFVLASGMGLDSIYNFQDGVDIIRLDGGLTFGALQIAQSGTSTLIKIASTGVTLASLVNTNSALIGATDFSIASAVV
ncbi:DUF4347 domain-containing protein [Microcoleus sp. S13_C5]|uniref:DUF4347 domain-containing protein n=1 Tax=Microcoleus sp. S13_C5 TaxID=3055411 RepID=UPI002FD5E6D7